MGEKNQNQKPLYTTTESTFLYDDTLLHKSIVLEQFTLFFRATRL